nr:MAG: hypothetical protein [Bacteriophage sp.]
MTIDEAITTEIEYSQPCDIICKDGADCNDCRSYHRQLVEWLEELKQYRAIGTLEECRAAVERNNEKTRIIDGITECCGYDFGIDAFQRELSKFCPVCGRKIERSDEE